MVGSRVSRRRVLFDFIMTFYCLILLFFSVDVPAIFCRQLSTAIPSSTCGQMRVGWSGTCKQKYFLHQISSFFSPKRSI